MKRSRDLFAFGFTPVTQSSSAVKSVRVDESGTLGHGGVCTASASSQSLLSLPRVPYMQGDFGAYKINDLSQSKLDDEGRLWLLQNAFRPDILYCFPSQEQYGKKRTLQHAWLRQFFVAFILPMCKWWVLYCLRTLCKVSS